MFDALSPYALLCASKPKSAPTVVSPYDLYSAVQSGAASAPQAASAPMEATPAREPPPAPASPAAMPRMPARRTHYIADIKTRHNAALRRTSLSGAPLSPANGR